MQHNNRAILGGAMEAGATVLLQDMGVATVLLLLDMEVATALPLQDMGVAMAHLAMVVAMEAGDLVRGVL